MTKRDSRREIHETKACLKREVLSPAKMWGSVLYSALPNFRWKLAERSEASLKVSEFNVTSEGKLTKEAIYSWSLWS